MLHSGGIPAICHTFGSGESILKESGAVFTNPSWGKKGKTLKLGVFDEQTMSWSQ